MTSCYLYIRFSSTKQERGDSKERQLTDCMRHIERNDWTLVEKPLEDLGVSAWKGDHLATGELGIFANRVRAGEIPEGSILVVEALDRLSRLKPRTTQRWLEEMTDHGLRIATVKDGRIYDRDSLEKNQFEIIEILMHARMAHLHSENISDKLQKSWVRRRAAAADTGRVMSAHLPGWLTVEGEGEGRRIVPHEYRAGVVREIYQMAADGAGLRRIASTLNERQEPTWGREYHHRKSTKVGWEHTYIGDILKSATVEGDYTPGRTRARTEKRPGEKVVGYFGEAIVPPELVAAARSRMSERKGTGGARRHLMSNLFSGLFFCGGCGGKMGMRSSAKPGKYLQCQNCYSGRGCVQRVYFNYNNFERAALAAMLPLALDDKFFQRPEATNQIVSRLAAIDKMMRDKNEEAEAAGESFLRTKSKTMETRMLAAEAEVARLEIEREEAEAALFKARGSVSPQEHMKRVVEVQGALNDPDEKTRLIARTKVSEAITGMNVQVRCVVDDGERYFWLVMAGGLFTARFDNLGNTVYSSGFGATVEPTAAEIEDMKRANPSWDKTGDGYLKRLKANTADRPAHPLDGVRDVEVPHVEGIDEEAVLNVAGLSPDDA